MSVILSFFAGGVIMVFAMVAAYYAINTLFYWVKGKKTQ